MRISLVAVALLAAVALAGCGDDDEPTKGSSESTSDETSSDDPGDPVDAVQKWVDAYASGDGKTACALQTDAYTKQDLDATIEQGLLEEGATCEEGVAIAANLAKEFGIDVTKATLELVDESDDEATVGFTLDDTSTEYGLVVVDGEWLIDSETE